MKKYELQNLKELLFTEMIEEKKAINLKIERFKEEMKNFKGIGLTPKPPKEYDEYGKEVPPVVLHPEFYMDSFMPTPEMFDLLFLAGDNPYPDQMFEPYDVFHSKSPSRLLSQCSSLSRN